MMEHCRIRLYHDNNNRQEAPEIILTTDSASHNCCKGAWDLELIRGIVVRGIADRQIEQPAHGS